MATLITIARAQENPVIAAACTSNSAYVTDLLNTASVAVEDYLKRKVLSASYRTYLSGMGFPNQEILLPNSPVISVNRVCPTPSAVISIVNTDTANNQYARVSTQIDTTGATLSVTLLLTASATDTTTVLTATSYPTIQSLANAITALGYGWSAQAMTGYELYPVADLRPLQGAQSCLSTSTTLSIYMESTTSTTGAGFGGWVAWSGLATDQEPWRLDADAGILYGWFPQGQQNIRVDYTAGYATCPPPIQEAVVRVMQIMWQTINRNSNVRMSKMGPFQQNFTDTIPLAIQDPQVTKLLGPYVSYSNLNAVY